MQERAGELIYVDQSKLTDTGRMQCVITSKESEWAVRNLKDDQKGLKFEPHLEAGVGVAAENLFKFCYQDNLRSHIFSSEKYLFLQTTCRNPNFFPELFNTRVINGFIRKIGYGFQVHPERGKRYFVFGEPFVVGFLDAIPVTQLGYRNHIRVQLVDEKRTAQILERFSGIKNSVSEYVKEIERLDPKGETCVLTKGEHCIFESSCLRAKPFLKK